ILFRLATPLTLNVMYNNNNPCLNHLAVSLLDGGHPSKSLDLHKVLPEAIQQLQSKLAVLEYNVSALTSQLSEEKEARYVLQTVLRNYLRTAATKEFVEAIEWPSMESNI
ncbi:unnamed protein product, partial [Callosobruchus maculatus]